MIEGTTETLFDELFLVFRDTLAAVAGGIAAAFLPVVELILVLVLVNRRRHQLGALGPEGLDTAPQLPADCRVMIVGPIGDRGSSSEKLVGDADCSIEVIALPRLGSPSKEKVSGTNGTAACSIRS